MESLNIGQFCAKYSLGILKISQYPDFAMALLEAGVDTPLIIRLASMTANDDPDELCRYMKSIVAEKSVMIFHSRKSSLILALMVAEDFLSSEGGDVIVCIRDMIWYLEQYDFLSEGDIAYESIAFDDIFGCYHAHRDLIQDIKNSWNEGEDFIQTAHAIVDDLPNKLQSWVSLIKKFV